MARNTPVIVSVADTINLATLSATLGPSTREEARALAPEETDEALVELGNSVSTERVDDDALRILHAAAEFFATASKERKAKVYLSPEFVRVAAWSALQGHDAWSASATRRSVKGTAVIAREVETSDRMKLTRQRRDQLAEAIARVGGSSAWRVKVTAAVRPGASGMPEARADVGLASLVALGRPLLASKKADVQVRVKLYALTEKQLAEAETLAAETAKLAGKAGAPKRVVTQADVDLWDGLNLVILEQVTRAFAHGNRADPTVPKLGFVSLRSRVSSKGKKTPGVTG